MAWSTLTGVPDGLASKFRAGQPLTLIARYSSPHGQRARRAAVQDLLGAADALAKMGVDIRPDLPTSDELIERLRTASPTRSVGGDGRRFTNRFVVVDLRAQHGVYVILSVGSGRKLDDTATQPFVTYVWHALRSTGSCFLFARRLDRITRRSWALSPVMLYLGDCGGFIGDRKHGIRTAMVGSPRRQRICTWPPTSPGGTE